MKFLCAGCNQLQDVERFRIDGAALVVTCASCSAESRAEPAGALATVTPLRMPTVDPNAFEVPEGHCPKCISRRQANTEACATCGLVYAQSPTGAFAPSETLKAEWLQLTQTWGDEAKHEALRSTAFERGELAEVGRLYRLRRVAQPGDPLAQRGLDEVLRLAVLPSLASRQAKGGESEVPTWKYVALSAVIVACLIVIALLVRQMLTLS